MIQVAGLLTGKAMAAYAALTPGDVVTYVQESRGGNIGKVRDQRRDLSPAIQAG